MNHPSSEQIYRILIFNQFFPPDYAATGQLIEELAVGISRKGIRVRVFSGQPGYAFDTVDAPRKEIKGRLQIRRSRVTQILRLGLLAKILNSSLFFLRAFLHTLRHQHKEDLLIVTTAPAFMTWLGYLSYRIWKKKYICLIYDLYPNVLTQLGTFSEKHPIVKLWHKLNEKTWLNAREIIVLSSTMKDRIVEVCPSVEPKITVIHNWADGDAIKPIAKEDNWFAQEYGVDKKFTILYSGNMGRCHDMTTILEAANLLKDYQDKFQFIFIGQGAQQEIIKEKVDSLGLQNFSFLPYQKKEILPYSLTACDVSLISMSKGMDGVVAPSKLYSTLAAGNAVGVICPKKSFLKDLVVSGRCGKSFRNGDAEGLSQFLLELSHQPQLVKEMGYNARQYFDRNFTKEIAINKYLDVIERASNPSCPETVLQ